MTMRQEIAKLNYRQKTLFSGMIGIGVKTVQRYLEDKGSSRSTVTVIQNGWKDYKKQIKKVK